jgi:hypothetical protein
MLSLTKKRSLAERHSAREDADSLKAVQIVITATLTAA